MTEAFRRFLWLLPVLVLGALLIFFALGSTSSQRAKLHRPLFYNSSPRSAQGETREAIRKLIAGEIEAATTIKKLGGAALPTILARLPAMEIADQRLVASALLPVAMRMGSGESDGWNHESTRATSAAPQRNANSDQQLLFWSRYNDEHALDLRPLAVSRLVRRLSQRDAARRSADLLAVDTFALPTLIANLGRITDQEDIDRCRRLVTMIAHVTERDFHISESATLEEASIQVSLIRAFWDEEGYQWTQLDRFSLLVARFTQTEFAGWTFRSVRQFTGLDHRGLFVRLRLLAKTSLPLFAWCLFGMLIVGPAIAASIQVFQLRGSRWHLERWGLRAVLAAGLIGVIPLVLSPQSSSFARLSFTALLVGTVFSNFTLHRELSDRLDWRTHHVLRTRTRLNRIGAVARWIAPSIPTLTPIAVAEAAVWVTCLEVSSSTAGIGTETLSALRTGDLDFLMLVCLGLGLGTGTAQVLADLLLGSTQARRGYA